MADALMVRESCDYRETAADAVASGEVAQMPDGRAGVYTGLNAAVANDTVNYTTEGTFDVTKTANVVILRGGDVFWDHSANSATFKKVNDRDFFIGTAAVTAAAADATVRVRLNKQAHYLIDIHRDPVNSVNVGTAAAGAFGYPVQLGGCTVMELTATNEAQKNDLLSVDGFALGANAIVEVAFRILSDGSNATQDFNVGIANGTHASDADAITESLFVHIDGNSTNIAMESDDGTTEVAATDTTTDYTEGTAVANRVEVWFDLATLTDIQAYVEGVNVLPATEFKLNAATGPMFLLAHLEKSAGTDVYKVAIDKLRVRIMEQ